MVSVHGSNMDLIIRSKWRMMGLIVVVIIVILLVLFLNPYDVLTKKSSSFSFDRFDKIKIGDPISLAIDTLGDPISTCEVSSINACKAYDFMGDYPDWVFGGTECWLLVDENGTVVEKRKVVEP